MVEVPINIANNNISFIIFFYTTRILIIVATIIIVRYGGLGVVEVPNSNGTNLLSRPNLRLRLIIMIISIIIINMIIDDVSSL